jgi:hypothetical protein
MLSRCVDVEVCSKVEVESSGQASNVRILWRRWWGWWQ